MQDFIIGWIICLVFTRVYLGSKDIKINKDVLSLIISFSIIFFLSIIQLICNFLIHLFI